MFKKRKVNRSKKSNIKCEHCQYWTKFEDFCILLKEHKNYWNRCKSFKWREDI